MDCDLSLRDSWDAADIGFLVRMEVDEMSAMIADLAMQGFLWGVIFAGVSAFMGLGVGAAIELFKSFGGVR